MTHTNRKDGTGMMTSYVVAYRESKDDLYPVKYYATYAESAQDAADQVRFWSADNVVTEVFKKVKNWK